MTDITRIAQESDKLFPFKVDEEDITMFLKAAETCGFYLVPKEATEAQGLAVLESLCDNFWEEYKIAVKSGRVKP